MENYNVQLTGSPLEIAAKKKAIEAIIKLSSDDSKRIVEIMKNPKALAMLKSKWLMLKAMF